MANPLYGFSVWKSPTNGADVVYPLIATNSTQFTIGDPVTASGGFAIVAPNATSAIIGIAAKSFTATSTNQTVAQAYVPLYDIDQDYTFLAGTNSDISNTSAGLLFQMLVSGGTGQVLVDTNGGSKSAGSTGIVVCLGADPSQLGTTGVGGGSRQGLFRFVKKADTQQT